MRAVMVALLVAGGSLRAGERNDLNVIAAADVDEIRTRVEELVRLKRYLAAADHIHRLLSEEQDRLFPAGDGRYLPLKRWLMRMAGKLPEEARKDLEEKQESAARAALASLHRRTPENLVALAHRFPLAPSIEDALVMAADIRLEAGEFARARALYLAASGRKPSKALAAKTAVATAGCGLDALARRILPAGVPARWLAEARAAAERPRKRSAVSAASPLPRRVRSVGMWPLPGQDREARVYHSAPDGRTSVRSQPVFAFGRFYVPTRTHVLEIDPVTGNTRRFACGGAVANRDRDHLYTVTVTPRRVFASFPFKRCPPETHLGIPMRMPVARRAVAVFDRKTAKFVGYLHEFDGFEKRFGKRAFSMPSPPVVRGSRLFCEMKIFGNMITSYIMVFDVSERRLVKAVPLCANGVELTMWELTAREPLSSPPASDGRVFYLCSDLGLVAAFDMEQERLLWAAEYEQMEIPSAANYLPRYRRTKWAAAPPRIESGVVVAAPLDSAFLTAFDAETGRVLWRYRYDTGITAHHFQTLDGRVLVWGDGLAALDLRGGRLLAVNREAFGPFSPDVGPAEHVGDALLVTARGSAWRLDAGADAEVVRSLPVDGRLLRVGRWILSVDRERVRLYEEAEK